MRIYLASSWRNPQQPELVEVLRRAGHDVYDFRNPRSGGPVLPETPTQGFSWRQCDSNWREAPDPRAAYRDMLAHPVARAGFAADFGAMQWADGCVLALPSGRSAHIEGGWMAGAGKRLVVYVPPSADFEPELMYLVGGEARHVIALSVDEVLAALEGRP